MPNSQDPKHEKATGKPGTQSNEGEGNRTAAREYNRRAERFAKSGAVEKKAKEAKKALEGAEGKELAEAEEIGKSHRADDDV